MQRKHKNSLAYENPLKAQFSSQFFKTISQNPGVYFMLDRSGDPLYIGKAKNLKNRISSYGLLRPGNCPDHSLEMIQNVFSIKWIECRSEDSALRRENELLHALRPPFNIAHTEAEHYLFIGIKEGGIKEGQLKRTQTQKDLLHLDFQLSSRTSIEKEGYQLYGCYKHRRRIKSGYTALLRLIYAATFNKSRFSYPAPITRLSPPWLYSMPIPTEWKTMLCRFLDGRDGNLLHALMQRLLENENLPLFMRPSIQEDIDTVVDFYKIGPKSTFEIKKKNKLKHPIVSHTQMDRFIALEIDLANLAQLPRSA